MQLTLLIGGNQGDRSLLLQEAVRLISGQMGNIVVCSSVYETEPWGFEAEQRFLNQAVVVDTPLTPQAALSQALHIEGLLGRIRPSNPSLSTDGEKHYSSRPMDIDLIFCDQQVIDTPALQIPHPRMHLRRFVLEPLCEVMPDFEHPVLHKTLQQLLTECPDNGQVTRL